MDSAAFYYSSFSFSARSDPFAPHLTTTIPIESPPPSPTPIARAAIKIQSAYRSHRIRSLVRRLAAAASSAARLESLLRTQETVDAVRRDPRERIRLSEALMAVLLELDGVPGLDGAVRDLRRRLSRRVVGLQEVLDAVAEERVVGLEGFPLTLEEVVFGDCGGGGESGGGPWCFEDALGICKF